MYECGVCVECVCLCVCVACTVDIHVCVFVCGTWGSFNESAARRESAKSPS